jgi:hypothetical protein
MLYFTEMRSSSAALLAFSPIAAAKKDEKPLSPPALPSDRLRTIGLAAVGDFLHMVPG